MGRQKVTFANLSHGIKRMAEATDMNNALWLSVDQEKSLNRFESQTMVV